MLQHGKALYAKWYSWYIWNKTEAVMKLLVIPAGYTYIPVNVYLIYFMQGFISVADRALLFSVPCTWGKRENKNGVCTYAGTDVVRFLLSYRTLYANCVLIYLNFQFILKRKYLKYLQKVKCTPFPWVMGYGEANACKLQMHAKYNHCTVHSCTPIGTTIPSIRLSHVAWLAW